MFALDHGLFARVVAEADAVCLGRRGVTSGWTELAGPLEWSYGFGRRTEGHVLVILFVSRSTVWSLVGQGGSERVVLIVCEALLLGDGLLPSGVLSLALAFDGCTASSRVGLSGRRGARCSCGVADGSPAFVRERRQELARLDAVQHARGRFPDPSSDHVSS